MTIDKDVNTVEIPLWGTITAGEPIEAIEIPDETVAIAKALVGGINNYFALRVRGSSMIDEGIFDGDIVDD